MTAYVKDKIIAFEAKVAYMFDRGEIKYPIHLRSGREDMLISYFKLNKIKPTDHVFAYWDSHDIALLKGVGEEELLECIKNGRSIALWLQNHRIYCSGIVGSLLGAAVGLGWAIKNTSERVFVFCGDMTAHTGIFHEATTYAKNFDLPVQFLVTDNGLSVMTDTSKTWGEDNPVWGEKVSYGTYKNGYPHSGIGKVVKF